MSQDRILTTHVGSLPRPAPLVAVMRSWQDGAVAEAEAVAPMVRAAVADVVARQAALGIDIVADGEMGKLGFIPYINERLGGFTPSARPAGGSYWGASREAQAFPEYYEWVNSQPGTAGGVGATRWTCRGAISYQGHRQLGADIATLRAALAGQTHVAAFMPAISPTNVEEWNFNEFYSSQQDYLYAIADALAEEYRAIIDAGLMLQIDDPQLATYYVLNPDKSIEECRAWAAAHVEVLNHALAGIPREKVRYHTCYSINMGPRVHDMELRDIIDIMLGVNAGAFSFEAANPRHEHEWRLWGETKLRDDVVLIPGVISHSTTLVEHPELVRERILRFAGIVGRERVIAGADCGFASFATSHEMHASIVWAKLGALVAGAKLASADLWGAGQGG